jgi:hypothetical protein
MLAYEPEGHTSRHDYKYKNSPKVQLVQYVGEIMQVKHYE